MPFMPKDNDAFALFIQNASDAIINNYTSIRSWFDSNERVLEQYQVFGTLAGLLNEFSEIASGRLNLQKRFLIALSVHEVNHLGLAECTASFRNNFTYNINQSLSALSIFKEKAPLRFALELPRATSPLLSDIEHLLPPKLVRS